MAPRVRPESKSFIFKTALYQSEAEIEQNFARDRGGKMVGDWQESKHAPSRTTQQRNTSVAKASEGMPKKQNASMPHVTEKHFPGEEASQSAQIGNCSYFSRVREVETPGTSAWAFKNCLATSRICDDKSQAQSAGMATHRRENFPDNDGNASGNKPPVRSSIVGRGGAVRMWDMLLVLSLLMVPVKGIGDVKESGCIDIFWWVYVGFWAMIPYFFYLSRRQIRCWIFSLLNHISRYSEVMMACSLIFLDKGLVEIVGENVVEIGVNFLTNNDFKDSSFKYLHHFCFDPGKNVSFILFNVIGMLSIIMLTSILRNFRLLGSICMFYLALQRENTMGLYEQVKESIHISEIEKKREMVICIVVGIIALSAIVNVVEKRLKGRRASTGERNKGTRTRAQRQTTDLDDMLWNVLLIHICGFQVDLVVLLILCVMDKCWDVWNKTRQARASEMTIMMMCIFHGFVSEQSYFQVLFF
jgi:hypothetical protein